MRWIYGLILSVILLISSITITLINAKEENITPFEYFYPPKNSFGMEGFKYVNWFFFEDSFTYVKTFNNQSSNYELEIEFNKTINVGKYKYKFKTEEAGFYGLEIIFDGKNENTYYDIENYTFCVNYSNGIIGYNFTDIINTFDGILDYWTENNIFHLKMSKYFEEDFEVELDPVFGTTTSSSNSYTIENMITGSNYTTSVYGSLDNLTVYLFNDDGGTDWIGDVKGAVYRKSDYALIASTETRELTLTKSKGNEGWFTFNFTSTYYVNATTEYILCIWSESQPGACKVSYISGSQYAFWDSETFGDWVDPLDPMDFSGYNFSIYCSYTEVIPTIHDDLKYNQTNIINGSTVFSCDIYNFSCYTYNVNNSNTYNLTINNSFGDTITYNNIINQTVLLNFSDYIYVEQNITIWINLSNGTVYWNYTFWFITQNEFCECLKEENFMDIGMETSLLMLVIWIFIGYLTIRSKEKEEMIPLTIALYLVGATMVLTYDVYETIFIVTITTCIAIVPYIRIFKKW